MSHTAYTPPPDHPRRLSRILRSSNPTQTPATSAAVLEANLRDASHEAEVAEDVYAALRANASFHRQAFIISSMSTGRSPTARSS
jgi:hypothetical protein